MIIAFLTTIGGVGLFILGMSLLTDGLRTLTGGALRRGLKRATRNRFNGVLTGLVSTAILQSSSATTVTTIGFVGAGLITFQQSLGIIFGANIGTTFTGWIVTLLGFKLDLGIVAMPMVLLGGFMRLAGRGKAQPIGLALAGFSLLFFGIEGMQSGMSGLETVLNPSTLPGDSMAGRLGLVLLGTLITVITQSSSAGVVTALAALGVGAISFPQAAAMVIGMNVGTTITAMLATIGGSTASRRTGYAHVLFNLVTGVIAFALLTPLGRLVGSGTLALLNDPLLALVTFHTAFNIVGVMLFTPITDRFAQVVIHLVPDREESLTTDLNPAVLTDSQSAIDNTTGALIRIAYALADDLLMALGQAPGRPKYTLETIDQALQEVRDFAGQIPATTGAPLASQRRASLYHLIDHLARLSRRMRRTDRIRTIKGNDALMSFAQTLTPLLEGRVWLGADETGLHEFESVHNQLDVELNRFRQALLSAPEPEKFDLEEALKRLDAIRWMERVSDHLWRIAVHVNFIRLPEQAAQTALPEEPGDIEELDVSA
ncbi:MAG: Na/Pi cotransporter family protein [Alphaproteobacteria bacterium]|nr:MAG: Na/Pi cotransporter family protein [Alphaproteobacteria bacterium]